jgi:hypothetical protein
MPDVISLSDVNPAYAPGRVPFCGWRVRLPNPPAQWYAAPVGARYGRHTVSNIRGITMVKYPQIRNQVIDTLQTLSDPEYQRRVWVKHDVPAGYEDCFDFAVNMLFDDTTLADDPEKAIDDILKNKEEADAIRPVTKAIGDLLNKLGTQRTDEEYINDPDWTKVIEAAKIALQIMESTE